MAFNLNFAEPGAAITIFSTQPVAESVTVAICISETDHPRLDPLDM